MKSLLIKKVFSVKWEGVERGTVADQLAALFGKSIGTLKYGNKSEKDD